MRIALFKRQTDSLQLFPGDCCDAKRKRSRSVVSVPRGNCHFHFFLSLFYVFFFLALSSVNSPAQNMFLCKQFGAELFPKSSAENMCVCGGDGGDVNLV